MCRSATVHRSAAYVDLSFKHLADVLKIPKSYKEQTNFTLFHLLQLTQAIKSTFIMSPPLLTYKYGPVMTTLIQNTVRF